MPLTIEPIETAQHGLSATYYNSLGFRGSAVRTIDPTVNFTWGSAPPRPGIAPKTYSVRWTGQIQVDAAGTYTFETLSDDGMRLFVDGSLIVNAWSDHSVRHDFGAVSLSPGRHDIRVDYYQDRGVSRAGLMWSKDEAPFAPIPTADLYPGSATR